jgi:chemotaxis protein methyltransferase CheR
MNSVTQIKTASSLIAQTQNASPDPMFLRIRDLIYKVSGIYQHEDKLRVLVDACSRRMREVKAVTPAQYWDYLTAHPSRDSEIRQLLNEVAVGETYLFRNPLQLDAFRKAILPELAAARGKAAKRLRIWSAGCSTGEEPYSIAISILEENSSLLKNWHVDVIATDLNDRALAAAEKGIYAEDALRNIPQPLRAKYFSPREDGTFEICPEAKKLVHFSRLNLTDASALLSLNEVDVIFCCNVLVYFDGTSKSRVIESFFNNLTEGGYLFLGACESLLRLNDQFRVVHFPGTIAYWKPPFRRLCA